jgi:hypothetical protein
VFDKLKTSVNDQIETNAIGSSFAKGVALVIIIVLLLSAIVGFIWDTEPDTFDIRALTDETTQNFGVKIVTGSATVATTMAITEKMLNKRGGYLTNDVIPPSIWMDNVPNWEYGVIVQIRDMTRTLRNNMSRSQSQSTEDPALTTAENQFYFDTDSWAFPQTESEYSQGRNALADYLKRLGDQDQQSAQFYARADNLVVWLTEVDTRLGSLSQRLSTSVGKRQLDVSLAGDPSAKQSTGTTPDVEVKTPWSELDDVFYEARGTTWALLHLLKAVEIDFRDVLEKKNALVSLQQIIREIEPTQDTLWSPLILNGSGFGLLANHSLVMGAHISRANAAIVDLRRLLQDG